MRTQLNFSAICLIGFIALVACSQPAAPPPPTEPPAPSYQLIEFYSPL
jgi:hypothetical protein